MNERDALFLVHVLDATADIEAFTAEGCEALMSDRKTQSAFIRQLESSAGRSRTSARRCP